uniref:Uncharacterized protein n=1 Tax=Lygus hesperus TaxID=30085 RepID=A0A0A9Z7Y8_LYGHE
MCFGPHACLGCIYCNCTTNVSVFVQSTIPTLEYIVLHRSIPPSFRMLLDSDATYPPNSQASPTATLSRSSTFTLHSSAPSLSRFFNVPHTLPTNFGRSNTPSPLVPNRLSFQGLQITPSPFCTVVETDNDSDETSSSILQASDIGTNLPSNASSNVSSLSLTNVFTNSQVVFNSDSSIHSNDNNNPVSFNSLATISEPSNDMYTNAALLRILRLPSPYDPSLQYLYNKFRSLRR